MIFYLFFNFSVFNKYNRYYKTSQMMIFELMGAFSSLGKLATIDDVKEFFQSIPDFFQAVNSCLPENRAVRLVIYGTGVACMVQFSPYLLRHTELFDYYYRHMDFIHRYCPVIEEQKQHLFTEMKQHMEELPRYAGKFFVLEIQAGGGANLTYYPEDTVLVATDYNENYETQMLQNFEESNGTDPLISNTTLKRFIKTIPERLKGVPDNTISAVVCIHTLCLSLDLNRTLDEIKRVLIPNGRLYFIEHVAADGFFNWKSFNQMRLMPAFAMVGCHLRRRTQDYLQAAGFSALKYENVNVDFSRLRNTPIRSLSPHIFGYAVK